MELKSGCNSGYKRYEVRTTRVSRVGQPFKIGKRYRTGSDSGSDRVKHAICGLRKGGVIIYSTNYVGWYDPVAAAPGSVKDQAAAMSASSISKLA